MFQAIVSFYSVIIFEINSRFVIYICKQLH